MANAYSGQSFLSTFFSANTLLFIIAGSTVYTFVLDQSQLRGPTCGDHIHSEESGNDVQLSSTLGKSSELGVTNGYVLLICAS
jgi:hypothetical protein